MTEWLLTDEEMIQARQTAYEYVEIKQSDIDKGIRAIAKAQAKKMVQRINLLLGNKPDVDDQRIVYMPYKDWQAFCKEVGLDD